MQLKYDQQFELQSLLLNLFKPDCQQYNTVVVILSP